MRNAAWACNALVAMALSFPAGAQDAKPAPCGAPEHRQFDFWLGDWEVRGPAGKVVGQNTIASIHRGCVLLESWKGEGGVTGSSFNVYDPDRKKWRQTWVDSSGGILDLEGAFANGRMVLASAPDSKGTTSRITWERLPDGRVRQIWETSSDGGATWKVAFDGYYSKR
ncbi:MAG: hypothetical protein U1F41_11030 [Burkholderiales bacterium]